MDEIGLQWGRSVNAAETRQPACPGGHFPARFNGAAALTLRKPVGNNPLDLFSQWLQWGRSVNAAETGALLTSRGVRTLASMGPQR